MTEADDEERNAADEEPKDQRQQRDGHSCDQLKPDLDACLTFTFGMLNVHIQLDVVNLRRTPSLLVIIAVLALIDLH